MRFTSFNLHGIVSLNLSKRRNHFLPDGTRYHAFSLTITDEDGQRMEITLFTDEDSVKIEDNYTEKPVVICSACSDTLPCGHGTEINDEGRCVLCGGEGPG